MTVKQGLPYKIATQRAKRYATHYNILPEKCLIVPTRLFESEASCDIRWEDDNGELFLLQNKFFACENLVPLNAMLEPKLQELWQHYYDASLNTPVQSPPEQKRIDPIFFQSIINIK